jgi:DNA-directed RNA polymerase specialized sigma24 family protein
MSPRKAKKGAYRPPGRKATPPTDLDESAVMTLRDAAGFGADGACTVLGIKDAEQRVHLHRARTAVRAAVEELLRPAA